jgi:hypothetical protein
MNITKEAGPMSTTISPVSGMESLAWMRDVNESLRPAASGGGTLVLDVYEAALESIAACQEQAARSVGVDWISTVLDAQAMFTRQIAKVSVSSMRPFLP